MRIVFQVGILKDRQVAGHFLMARRNAAPFALIRPLLKEGAAPDAQTPATGQLPRPIRRAVLHQHDLAREGGGKGRGQHGLAPRPQRLLLVVGGDEDGELLEGWVGMAPLTNHFPCQRSDERAFCLEVRERLMDRRFQLLLLFKATRDARRL